MLMKGSKIKLKKEIPLYQNTSIKVGDVFEVTGIGEDGLVTFKSDYGFGVMGLKEYLLYFEDVKEKRDEFILSESGIDQYSIIPLLSEYEKEYLYDVSYSTDREKYVKVRLRMYNKDGEYFYYGKASCDPFDKFDFNVGYRVALVRAFSNALLHNAIEK